jgi:hypothetical protein
MRRGAAECFVAGVRHHDDFDVGPLALAREQVLRELGGHRRAIEDDQLLGVIDGRQIRHG